jgi:hypothetical protein
MKRALFFLFLLAITTLAEAQVANQPNDLMACDGNFLAPDDGWAIFDLTTTVPEILGTQDPSLYVVIFLNQSLIL